MSARAVAACAAGAALLTLTGCGSAASDQPAAADTLMVSPQNSSFTVGVDRVSVALLDSQRNPVTLGNVQVQLLNPAGRNLGSQQFSNVAAQYGGIPVYIGIVRFPDVGQFRLVVHGRRAGADVSGNAYVTVTLHSQEVAVGSRAPAVSQPIVGDPGVTVAKVDSGVPPDAWHNATIAQGLAQHRPMVLFFGDPAFCPSKTCGPTRDILEQLCTQYCGKLLFEHIETYYPAQPPGPNAPVNPAFTAFGLQTDPWIYFVNANGMVSDRYEGPVTLQQLVASAEGTLAGNVPAVGLTPS